jgi:hypothetical protein
VIPNELLTVADLLDGRSVDYPRVTGANVTFKQAPKAGQKDAEALDLLL